MKSAFNKEPATDSGLPKGLRPNSFYQNLITLASVDSNVGTGKPPTWSKLGTSGYDKYRPNLFKYEDPYKLDFIGYEKRRQPANKLVKFSSVTSDSGKETITSSPRDFTKSQYYGGFMPSSSFLIKWLRGQWGMEVSRKTLSSWGNKSKTRFTIPAATIKAHNAKPGAKQMTSGGSYTHDKLRLHYGLDVQTTPRWTSKLIVPEDMLIIYNGTVSGYGNRLEMVGIYSGRMISYSHMATSKITQGLMKGSIISAGSTVGISSGTTANSTGGKAYEHYGPHLHLECGWAGSVQLPNRNVVPKIIDGRFNPKWKLAVKRHILSASLETSVFTFLACDLIAREKGTTKTSITIKDGKYVSSTLGARLPSAAKLFEVGILRNPWYYFTFTPDQLEG